MKRYVRALDRVVGGRVSRLPSWFKPVMQVVTLLGEPPVTVGIAAAVLGYGLALGKEFYQTAGIIALATLAATSLLKLMLRRARPLSEYAMNMWIKTFSFPSGHAAGSLVSFGLAALVISYRWPELAVFAWIVALICVLLISLSRIYLEAHYASDIIGGWVVGSLGLLAILLIEK